MTPAERTKGKPAAWSNKNAVDQLRRDAYRITDNYSIPRDKALLLIAECDSAEIVAARPEEQHQIWRDQIQQKCIDATATMKGEHKNPPTPNNRTSVPNDSMMFEEACARHYVPKAKYLYLKGLVYERAGKHADIATYKRTWLEVCKEHKEARPTVRDEFDMSKQDGLFGDDKPVKIAKWTTAESDAYEASVADICKEHNIPANLVVKFKKDILKANRDELIAAGKKPDELLKELETYAFPWAQENVPVNPDLTPSPDGYDPDDSKSLTELEKSFEGLNQAVENLTSVVNQNGSEPPTAMDTTSAQIPPAPSLELGNANQAPANAPDALNVIEGEIVEDKPAEPTIAEINEYRAEAMKLINAAYPGADIGEQSKHHEAATGEPTAIAALKKHGKEKALALVSERCAKAPKPITQAVNQSGTALALIEQSSALTSTPSFFRVPTMAEMQYVDNLAVAVAKSGFYPAVNTVEKAKVIMFKGLTLGIEPMSALDGIDPIPNKQGGITMFFRSKLLKALAERTGQCMRFDVFGDDKKCTAVVQRKGREIHTYTYTIEEAAAAGLTDKYIWKAHAKRMLAWRVIGIAVDIDFPEVRYVMAENDPSDDDILDAADVAEQKAIAA